MIVCKDLEELDPTFRAQLQAALDAAKNSGLEMVVIETYRSQERQDELYAKGRTTEGPIVTRAKVSKHTSRLAADCVPMVDGKITWNNKALFDHWGAIAEACGLVWGGHFSGFYDGAHVQASWA